MISDESGKYNKNYMKIYEVYLSKYKVLFYNGANELDAMLSFLSANSYEEMERIVWGKKESLAIMDELKKLSKEEDLLPEYDFEREMRRVTNTETEISKQEGKELSIREVAINFINNGVDLNIISNSTGLSIDELNNLKEEKKP